MDGHRQNCGYEKSGWGVGMGPELRVSKGEKWVRGGVMFVSHTNYATNVPSRAYTQMPVVGFLVLLVDD